VQNPPARVWHPKIDSMQSLLSSWDRYHMEHDTGIESWTSSRFKRMWNSLHIEVCRESQFWKFNPEPVKGCPLLALESTPRRKERSKALLEVFLHDYGHTFEACHILAFVQYLPNPPTATFITAHGPTFP
jgi:hypothetical protein